MTKDEYLEFDNLFEHCPANNCSKAFDCLRNKAYNIVSQTSKKSYVILNFGNALPTDGCTYYVPDIKERYALGASQLFDNILAKDLKKIKTNIANALGKSTYDKIMSKRRLITANEQNLVREILTSYGYLGDEIEFDEYKEIYPNAVKMIVKL